jgi:hypothetical protein
MINFDRAHFDRRPPELDYSETIRLTRSEFQKMQQKFGKKNKMAKPADQNPLIQYSYAIQAKDTLDVSLGSIADFTWNSFYRAIYEKSAAGIQRQANMLLARGNVTREEARFLVEVQRNGLVKEMRDPLTPFGRYYSEFLKPIKDLPNLDRLLAEKGTIEAVLRSVGKSRIAVNKIAFIARRAGPAAIAIDIVLTIVIVDLTPSGQRGKETAQQVGGLAGMAVASRYGGLAGAWAGSQVFLLLGSPTLAIPVVGDNNRRRCSNSRRYSWIPCRWIIRLELRAGRWGPHLAARPYFVENLLSRFDVATSVFR